MPSSLNHVLISRNSFLHNHNNMFRHFKLVLITQIQPHLQYYELPLHQVHNLEFASLYSSLKIFRYQLDQTGTTHKFYSAVQSTEIRQIMSYLFLRSNNSPTWVSLFNISTDISFQYTYSVQFPALLLLLGLS